MTFELQDTRSDCRSFYRMVLFTGSSTEELSGMVMSAGKPSGMRNTAIKRLEHGSIFGRNSALLQYKLVQHTADAGACESESGLIRECSGVKGRCIELRRTP